MNAILSMGSEQTDEEIAASVQRGDAESFGVLVERYEDRLLRYARRFLFGNPDAEDLVQDAFMKAYANIQSFDPRRRFSPWIYRIAHNEFVNTLRKRGAQPVFSFDPDTIFPHPLSSETADRGANDREMKELLERGLDKLDIKYREPLILFYLEERDYNDISDILGVPVSTVGVRLARGRALLKTIIETHGYS